MDYQITAGTDGSEITLRGKLTFESHEAFRPLLEAVVGMSNRSVIMDVSGLAFVDSAGLGLLLVLRETAEQAGVRLSLRRPRGQVRRLFRVSHFDNLVPVTEWGEDHDE